MSIVLIGLNHKTAPVEVREQFASHDSVIEAALLQLVDRKYIDEALIVSTCNRVEILASSPVSPAFALKHLSRFLADFHKLRNFPEQYLYTHTDRTAVHHVFRVAASLDSMVVGEPQILGQVKNAYTRAQEIGTIGRTLHQLMTRAFSVAKRVRTETFIGSCAISISSVAVEMAKTVFDQLHNRCVMLLGAGEMAEAALKHLEAEGVKQFIICNRTREKAEELVHTFGGEAIELSQLQTYLPKVDIVICSTGADTYVINYTDCRRTLEARRYRPLFFIDISVPRNIDPEVSKLENHFLFDIDDLQEVVNSNVRQRHLEAAKAENIVEKEVESFIKRLGSVDIGPTVAALKDHLNEVAEAEFVRARQRLGSLTPEQEQAIRQQLLTPLVNKFMHPLIVIMREGTRQNGSSIIDLYHKAYKLKNYTSTEDPEDRA